MQVIYDADMVHVTIMPHADCIGVNGRHIYAALWRRAERQLPRFLARGAGDA